ncbi:MAG: hypothetical protein HFF38_09750, partial [Lawsonibacter sp.]|nr:hypothetical protein [Lawsonibacter sp.]
TRDNVAELVYNTLFAQMVAFNDYRGQYVKNTNRDVVVTAGTDDEANTLAYNTFKLYVVEGIVMANGYTEKALAQSSTNNAQTTVLFTEDTDLDKDGRKEYKEGDEFDFNASTSLNLIGHAVKVYYTYTKKAPVVFAITDQAALTAVIEYDNNTTRLAEAANDAGFKKNSILDVKPENYYVNYAMDVTVEDASKYITPHNRWSDNSGISAPHFNLSGKKLLLISNSGNLDLSGEYDYVIVLDQYLDILKEVEEIRGDMEYVLKTNNGHATNGTLNVPLYDAQEGDYVVVTNIGLKDEVVVFYEANLVDATITRITGKSDEVASAKKITADGVTYVESSVWHNSSDTNLKQIGYLDDEVLTAFVLVKDLADETLILDEFGEMIGITEAEASRDYAYIAQYGVIHNTNSLNTDYQLTAHVFFADGTSGIYKVEECPNTIVDNPKRINESASGTLIHNGKVTPGTGLNQGNGQGTPGGNVSPYTGCQGALGIWNVTRNDDKGTIKIKNAYQSEQGSHAVAPGVRLVQSHSTLVKNNYAVDDNTGNAAGTPSAGGTHILYQNNSTVYFYVEGDYGPNYKDTDDIDVSIRTGVKNAHGFTNDDEHRGEGIRQVYSYISGSRQLVGAMLIEDVELYSSQVYYYNQGNYHYSSDGLTYELYDLDGNLVEKTYKDLKKADAQDKWDGFYLAKNDDIYPFGIDTIVSGTPGARPVGTAPDGTNNLYAWSNEDFSYHDETTETKKGDKTYYVVNDTAKYDEIVENFFGGLTPQGNIAESVKIVDTCNSGLTSVAKVVRALKQGVNDPGDLRISYSYNTDDYTIKAFFISKYDPDGTDAPNLNANGNRYFNDMVTTGFTGNNLDIDAYIYSIRNDTGSNDYVAADAGSVTATYTIQAYNSLTDAKLGDARTVRSSTGTITGDGMFHDTITLANPGFVRYYEITVTVKWTTGGGTTKLTATDTLQWVQ